VSAESKSERQGERQGEKQGERQGEKQGLRLQVYLAHAGIASRRAAEALIDEGRVSVNGVIIREQGSRVSSCDTVLLDGEPVQKESRLVYLALNKPPGYICSSSDPQGRPLAIGLLPGEIKERLYNVGRLDFMSCGLIFFTNDGDFAARLWHPGSGIEKEYLVEATGHIPDELIRAFEKGISIEGEHYRALAVQRLGSRAVEVTLLEGKNREIRRVFSHFHLHPFRLRRMRIGPVKLEDLEEGKSRPLRKFELEALMGTGDCYSQSQPPSPKKRSVMTW
jgi:23S rRNA pseudouridine2605 synthase